MKNLKMLSSNRDDSSNKTGSELNGQWKFKDLELCGPIPPHSPYGVSFHLPKFEFTPRIVNEDLELLSKLDYGYPRVFVHDFIKKLNQIILDSFQVKDLKIYTFPSSRIANDCKEYLHRHAETEEQAESLKAVRIETYQVPTSKKTERVSVITAVLFPPNLETLVQAFWQNTGEIMSSRFAAHCLRLMNHENLVTASKSDEKYSKRFERNSNTPTYDVALETGGTNTKYHQDQESNIKQEVRERVAKSMSVGNIVTQFPSADDVYLFPTGMSSIYNSLRLSLSVVQPHKSVCFGFPYKDTKKVLSQFGPGCLFYGNGESEDLESLEKFLEKESITMLICEFPTNPLLKSPDLLKLRELADKHNFILVLDDTLGNMINLQDQAIADVIVTSLTKIFSGYSDVIAGSITISPQSSRYEQLKAAMSSVYEDNLWCEDAAALEHNSRDLLSRAQKANLNSENLVELLMSHPLVKQVYYPKYTTPALYQRFQRPDSGYGSLFSIELHDPTVVPTFFDHLPFPKGPTLGTNFTLVMPYVILAHHKELPEVSQYGVYDHLIRVSVGLEDLDYLWRVFKEALDHANEKRD